MSIGLTGGDAFGDVKPKGNSAGEWLAAERSAIWYGQALLQPRERRLFAFEVAINGVHEYRKSGSGTEATRLA